MATSHIGNNKWAWLGAIVVLAVIVIGIVALRKDATVGRSGSPLLGSWARPNPQLPGTTRILTFQRDGVLVSRDVSDSSGAILQDERASWRVEGQALIFRERGRGIAALWESLIGRGPAEDRIPIISLTDKELRFGSVAESIVFRRVSGDVEWGGR